MSQGGGWKNCPECGKLFFVPEATWVYRRYVADKDGGKLTYFCKYSCLLKFDTRYEEEKKRKKKLAAIKGHKKRKEKQI